MSISISKKMEPDHAESNSTHLAAEFERKFIDLLNPVKVCIQPDGTNLVGQIKQLITELTGLDPPHNMDAFMFCELFANLFGDTVYKFVGQVFGMDFRTKPKLLVDRVFTSYTIVYPEIVLVLMMLDQKTYKMMYPDLDAELKMRNFELRQNDATQRAVGILRVHIVKYARSLPTPHDTTGQADCTSNSFVFSGHCELGELDELCELGEFIELFFVDMAGIDGPISHNVIQQKISDKPYFDTFVSKLNSAAYLHRTSENHSLSADALNRVLDHLEAYRDHMMRQIGLDGAFRSIGLDGSFGSTGPLGSSDNFGARILCSIHEAPDYDAERRFLKMLKDMVYPYENLNNTLSIVIESPITIEFGQLVKQFQTKLVVINSPFLMMVCYFLWQFSFSGTFEAVHIELFDSIFQFVHAIYRELGRSDKIGRIRRDVSDLVGGYNTVDEDTSSTYTDLFERLKEYCAQVLVRNQQMAEVD